MNEEIKGMTGNLRMVAASEKFQLVTESEWRTPPSKVYRCQVYLLPEPEDGGFSIIAANLPGVASQGVTEEEAVANIQDAFKEVLAVYAGSGQEIPWLPTPRDPEPGSIVRVVIVNG